MSIDFILCIGFGGPTEHCCQRRCDDAADCPFASRAECFVSGILGDNPARAARVAEVVPHYDVCGGTSPYNKLTEEQVSALETALADAGHALPVFVAYRHWAPWAVDVLRRIADQGLRKGLLLVLAPHQSSVSWDWYIKTVAEAEEALQDERGDDTPHIVQVAQPWWQDPGYIEALADRIEEVCADWDAERRAATAFMFTAHAIPKTIEDTSPYREQFSATAAAVAQQLGITEHAIAFQSQPGDSSIPWSSPDILSSLRDLHAHGVKEVVVQAAGFLVDHVEVLYDLDHEARELAEELGVQLHRAACVHDHPAFISCLQQRVVEGLEAAGPA